MQGKGERDRHIVAPLSFSAVPRFTLMAFQEGRGSLDCGRALGGSLKAKG